MSHAAMDLALPYGLHSGLVLLYHKRTSRLGYSKGSGIGRDVTGLGQKVSACCCMGHSYQCSNADN